MDNSLTSGCLISFAEADSAFHDAAQSLAEAHQLEHLRIPVDWLSLRPMLEQIQRKWTKDVAPFALALEDYGFRPDTILDRFNTCVVSAEDIVPIELLTVDSQDLGRLISISHIVAETPERLVEHGTRCLRPVQKSLHQITILPITEMPFDIPRIDQDLVKCAVSLSEHLSVDLVLRPNKQSALAQFSRADVQVLHVDSHAAQHGLQLDYGIPNLVPAAEFPAQMAIPVVLLIACSTARGLKSIGRELLDRGVDATIGAYFDWSSGGFTDDVTTPDVYDAFYSALIAGKTLGEAFVAAKKKMVSSVFNSGQLLLGNQFIQFGLR